MLAALALCLVQATSGASPTPAPEADLGTLVVHLVDRRGDLLVDGWTVDLELALGTPQYSQTSATVDPGTGVARCTALPAGLCSVSARHATGETIPPLEVELTAGVVTERELRLAVSAPIHHLYVSIVGRGVRELSKLNGRASDGSVVAFLPLTVSMWVARDAPPSSYTVALEDERFAPAQIEGLQVGQVGRLDLQGSVTLIIELRDECDGSPLPAQAVNVMTSRGNPGVLLPGSHALGTGAYAVAGLFPGHASGWATFEDRPTFAFDLGELVAGDTRRVVLDVPRGLKIEGHVRDAEGRPQGGLPVALVRLQADGSASRGAVLRTVDSDPDGSFKFMASAGHAYAASIPLTPWRTLSAPVNLTAGPVVRGVVDLTVDEGGQADLSFSFAHGALLSEYDVALVLADGTRLRDVDALSALRDRRGRMILRGLAEGPCQLVVTQRARPAAPGATESRSFGFLPHAGRPTEVTIDLREFPRAP